MSFGLEPDGELESLADRKARIEQQRNIEFWNKLRSDIDESKKRIELTAEFMGYTKPSTSGGGSSQPQNQANYATIDQLNSLKNAITNVVNGFTSQANAELAAQKQYGKDLSAELARVGVNLRADIDYLSIELDKVRKSVGTGQTLKIELVTPQDVSQIKINGQHFNFPKLLKALANQHHVYLYGPTGTGKTTAGHTAFNTLGLKVYPITVNRETSQYQFMGHVSKGEYYPGVAYEPYVKGGGLLVDELDNGNANANTTIKVLADNEEAFFPNGLKKRHKDFRILACANTIGTGANMQYIGRNQQDKALLNIFKFIPFEIDEAFEQSIAWAEYIKWGGVEDDEHRSNFDRLIKEIRLLREGVEKLRFNHIISPRNTKLFFRDIARGVDIQEATESILFRELTKDQTDKLLANVKANVKGQRGGAKPSDLISKAWGA